MAEKAERKGERCKEDTQKWQKGREEKVKDVKRTQNKMAERKGGRWKIYNEDTKY